MIFKTIKFAGPDEILEFANKVREAAGAEKLATLPLSIPGAPKHCLIASALGIGVVTPGIHLSQEGPSQYWPSGELRWVLRTKTEIAEKLTFLPSCTAKEYALRCENTTISPRFDKIVGYSYVELPEKIGNAATAFDRDAPVFEAFVA